jgi:hypothetical protein
VAGFTFDRSTMMTVLMTGQHSKSYG